jgi:alkanesulfonate monooxygenase SsuD/methylene tetrahydromethanopterin reductase-like flavin-dependent oxidoreductase (luciferase family)
MREVTIGIQMALQQGDITQLRKQWIKADELGVDRIWASDHLNAVIADADFMDQTNDGTNSFANQVDRRVFEGTTVQAAMAVTTSRAEIGCLVQSNGYRNPNMTAYVANTLDHLSGGRYVLGIGSGFLKADYDEFGYEYGTQRERSEKLARDLPTIMDRLAKVSPAPTRRVPLLIASMGDTIGLPLVAKYADMWHAYGPLEKISAKAEMLRSICRDIGRDPDDIEYTTYYIPRLIGGSDDTVEKIIKAGFTHLILLSEGPDWDLGELAETIEWRNSLQQSAAQPAG